MPSLSPSHPRCASSPLLYRCTAVQLRSLDLRGRPDPHGRPGSHRRAYHQPEDAEQDRQGEWFCRVSRRWRGGEVQSAGKLLGPFTSLLTHSLPPPPQILRQRRAERGALQLASPEVKFTIDTETQNPLDVGMYQVTVGISVDMLRLGMYGGMCGHVSGRFPMFLIVHGERGTCRCCGGGGERLGGVWRKYCVTPAPSSSPPLLPCTGA